MPEFPKTFNNIKKIFSIFEWANNDQKGKHIQKGNSTEYIAY